MVKYHTAGNTLSSSATGRIVAVRWYIPGYIADVANAIGPDIVSAYSSAKFVSGTKIRWEPSVSFTTTGRIFVGFCDNPEVTKQLVDLSSSSPPDYITAVKGLSTTISFPIWQETEVPFPTRLRRKRFDTNRSLASPIAVDELDRCMQTCMFIAGEGLPVSTTMGGFWYHDAVDVEGIHPQLS